jgi:glycerophosphoryl diester phosphodiesterase
VLEVIRRGRPDLVTSASSLEVRRALRRSYFRLPPARGPFAVFQMPFRLRGRRLLRRPFVRAARRAGVPVQAWIVDDPAEMRQIIGWGVTGIISDRPDLALEVIRTSPAGPTAALSGSPRRPAAP